MGPRRHRGEQSGLENMYKDPGGGRERGVFKAQTRAEGLSLWTWGERAGSGPEVQIPPGPGRKMGQVRGTWQVGHSCPGGLAAAPQLQPGAATGACGLRVGRYLLYERAGL